MSDLFNKLAMRRKGELLLPLAYRIVGILCGVCEWGCRCIISSLLSLGISGKGPAGGEAGDSPTGTGSAFARMSDVIPPLPAPQPTAEDEDDWEA